jgi:hypothetical protein
MLNSGLLQQSVIGAFPTEEACVAYANNLANQVIQNPYTQLIDGACKSEDQIKGTKS